MNLPDLPATLPAGTDVWPYMKCDDNLRASTAILGRECHVSQREDGGLVLRCPTWKHDDDGPYVVHVKFPDDNPQGVYAGFSIFGAQQ